VVGVGVGVGAAVAELTAAAGAEATVRDGDGGGLADWQAARNIAPRPIDRTMNFMRSPRTHKGHRTVQAR
jgi:hypothetical protein